MCIVIMNLSYILDSKSEINFNSCYVKIPSTETPILVSSDKINMPSSKIHELLLNGGSKIFVAGLLF